MRQNVCVNIYRVCVQMKAENLRNPKISLHVPIAAPKLELWALNITGRIYLIAAVDRKSFNSKRHQKIYMEWMVVSLNHILHLDRHGYGVECTLEVFDIYDHFVSLAFLSLFLCCNYAISQV